MDINLALTILAIVITAILGIYTILLTKKHKYKGKLELIVEKNINLYDSIVNNIDDLEILYKNQPIEENMNLLTIFLINTGVKDLSQEITEKHPTISFGKDSIIHNVRVISKSSELMVKSEIENNNVVIKNGLLRRDEYIYLEIFVETKEKYKPEDIIQFNYRISDFEETKPRKKVELKAGFPFLNAIFIGLLLGVLPSIIFTDTGKIDIYNLNIEMEISDTSVVFSYSDYYYGYEPQKGIPEPTLNKIRDKAKYIVENYNLFDIVFGFKPTTYVIDNYKVKYTYSHIYTLVMGLAFIITVIMIPAIFIWQYIRQKQNRKLLKLINNVTDELFTKVNIS